MRTYSVSEFEKDLENIVVDDYKLITVGARQTRRRYYNISCSFDTETTSYEYNGMKISHTYAMMFSIENKCEVLVRTWDDVLKIMDVIHNKFEKGIVPVYVHNLPFDFSGLNRWVKWKDTFNTSRIYIIKALSENNIEFRDSAILFAAPLSDVGDKLRNPIKKLKGDLDYNLKRHYKTELTKKEIEYCFHDVEILVQAIKEKIEDGEDMGHIPMTSTGFIRRYVREEMNNNKPYLKHVQQTLRMTDEEYEINHKAFRGGFTHANVTHSEEVLNNVTSYDITSSYPSVMVCEKFPMMRGFKSYINNIDNFFYNIANYLCVFPIAFYDIKEKVDFENILPSACEYCENIKEDNGRLISASTYITTITNIDFETICKFYSFKSFDVPYMYCYKKAYLPKPIINCILKLYKDKTELKDVPGREDDYHRAKSLLNSLFGMCVTNINQNSLKYEDGDFVEVEQKSAVERNNNNSNRFLFYPWGVFITAYARRNLFNAILEVGKDHVYSDTDSEKFLNGELHKEYFENYNCEIRRKMDKAMTELGFDVEMTRPKNIKGVEKQLGVFEFEHCYKEFKTLGAKRYLVRTEENEVILTVAGTSKHSTTEYMLNKTKTEYEEIEDKFYVEVDVDNIFEMFDNNMYIPAENTGKLSRTYNHLDIEFKIKDYLGNEEVVREKGGCHLEPASYTLSMEEDYLDLIFELVGFKKTFIVNY